MITTAPISSSSFARSAHRVFIGIHIALLLAALLVMAMLVAMNPEPVGAPQSSIERFDRAQPLIWLCSIIYSIVAPIIVRRLTIPTILGSAALTASLIVHAIVDPRNSSPYLWLLYAVPVFLPATIVAIRQRSRDR